MRGRVLITVSPSLAGGEGSRSTRPVRVINGESIGYRPFSEYVESQLPKWEVTRRITVDPYARRPRGRDDATFCGRGSRGSGFRADHAGGAGARGAVVGACVSHGTEG